MYADRSNRIPITVGALTKAAAGFIFVLILFFGIRNFNSLTTLQEEVTSLGLVYDKIKGSEETLDRRLNTVETSFAKSKKDLTELLGKVTAMDTRFTTQNIPDLLTKLEQKLEGKVTELNDKLKLFLEHQEKLQTLETAFEIHQTSVDDLKEKQKHQDESMKQLVGRLSKVDLELPTITRGIESLNALYTAISAQVQANAQAPSVGKSVTAPAIAPAPEIQPAPKRIDEDLPRKPNPFISSKLTGGLPLPPSPSTSPKFRPFKQPVSDHYFGKLKSADSIESIEAKRPRYKVKKERIPLNPPTGLAGGITGGSLEKPKVTGGVSISSKLTGDTVKTEQGGITSKVSEIKSGGGKKNADEDSEFSDEFVGDGGQVKDLNTLGSDKEISGLTDEELTEKISATLTTTIPNKLAGLTDEELMVKTDNNKEKSGGAFDQEVDVTGDKSGAFEEEKKEMDIPKIPKKEEKGEKGEEGVGHVDAHLDAQHLD